MISSQDGTEARRPRPLRRDCWGELAVAAGGGGSGRGGRWGAPALRCAGDPADDGAACGSTAGGGPGSGRWWRSGAVRSRTGASAGCARSAVTGVRGPRGRAAAGASGTSGASGPRGVSRTERRGAKGVAVAPWGVGGGGAGVGAAVEVGRGEVASRGLGGVRPFRGDGGPGPARARRGGSLGNLGGLGAEGRVPNGAARCEGGDGRAVGRRRGRRVVVVVGRGEAHRLLVVGSDRAAARLVDPVGDVLLAHHPEGQLHLPGVVLA